MADANLVALGYIAESTFGTTPGTPSFVALRKTSESLQKAVQTTTSQEIRSDRQIADLIRTGINAEGEIGIELSYGEYDPFFEAALFADSTWSSPVTVCTIDTNVSAAASDNSFNHTSAWASNPGQYEWIKVSGFTTAANNGFFKVLSVTGTKIIVEGGTLVDEAAGDEITITQGGSVTNGTTFAHFAIEKDLVLSDNTTHRFQLFNGMTVDRLGLTVPTSGVVTGSLAFVGKDMTPSTSSADAGSGYTASQTNDVLNSIENVTVIENGVIAAATNVSLDLANNLRARLQIGTLGAVSMGAGTMNLTGSFQQYFASTDLLDAFVNFTDRSLAYVFEDAAGNGYVFDVPSVKYSSGATNAGGINQDLIADLQWTARLDATESVTIRIARFAA